MFRDSTMRNGETLQLIENFVSKAENVLQTKVSQINSLQNKVDSLNVGVVKEVPAAIDIKETNGNNYATFNPKGFDPLHCCCAYYTLFEKYFKSSF